MNITGALYYLINIVSSLYILCVMLRFFLQWVKADFFNPLCQFLMKVTNPLLLPLRRVIPGFFKLDLAAVVLMLILQIIALLLMAVVTSYPIGWYVIIIAIFKLLQMVLNLFFWAILIRAVISWVSPHPHNPLVILLTQLTEPLLRPARRILPTISGFDLSPLVVLIILQLIAILFGRFTGL